MEIIVTSWYIEIPQGSNHTYINIMHFQDNIGELLKKFGKDGSLLLKMDLREYKSVLGKIHDRFQGSLRKTTGNRLLKEYSPWLSGFQGNQHLQTIEIPGKSSSTFNFVDERRNM